MGLAIEYQKQFTEIVNINLPGPQDPEAGMTGSELLHGFLAGLQDVPNEEVREIVAHLGAKWNVYYHRAKR